MVSGKIGHVLIIYLSYTVLSKNRLNLNCPTFAAFLDLQKAFDSVQRDFLFYKLGAAGIDGKMYFAIKALYSNPRACVQVNNEFTDWFDTPTGVRQGDTLSPTLFSLFINDLAIEINDLECGIKFNDNMVSILLYADDVVIISDSEVKLQTMLDTVYHWCQKWMLRMNDEKSNIVHFRKSKDIRSGHVFFIGGIKLEYKDFYKYLGVKLHETLDFSIHKEMLAASGTRALGSIINKYKTNKFMTYEVYTKLFTTCVTPILDYGSEIWGIYKCSQIEKVQNNAARVFLGVNRFAPILGIQGEIGWRLCQNRVNLGILRYWNRLINMNDNRLCKKVFLWDRSLTRDNWSYYVQDLFEKLNMDNFERLIPCDIKVSACKMDSDDMYEWLCNLSTKPKLRSYRKIKFNKLVEKYVIINLTSKERSLLAQLRIGILPINIEVGKYRNIPADQRFCLQCNNLVEDEIHFSIPLPCI